MNSRDEGKLVKQPLDFPSGNPRVTELRPSPTSAQQLKVQQPEFQSSEEIGTIVLFQGGVG
jgi:hypothetical protein